MRPRPWTTHRWAALGSVKTQGHGRGVGVRPSRAHHYLNNMGAWWGCRKQVWPDSTVVEIGDGTLYVSLVLQKTVVFLLALLWPSFQIFQQKYLMLSNMARKFPEK